VEWVSLFRPSVISPGKARRSGLFVQFTIGFGWFISISWGVTGIQNLKRMESIGSLSNFIILDNLDSKKLRRASIQY
jgi:hypothetical protein